MHPIYFMLITQTYAHFCGGHTKKRVFLSISHKMIELNLPGRYCLILLVVEFLILHFYFIL